MSIFKCKMCGGDLEVTEGINIIECAYCATKQTVPNADSEKKINLFNRANRLRIGGEFDKAASIYESIVAEFPEEAEAYWGLCLCNYGIEYVDDPATANKIPTCHRASFESLQKDENFNLALEYADVVAQKVYRDEAREIDRIMGEILAVSQNEKPYDVFICYKETDEKGERTADSVLAQEIYDALTAKGLKVFFSRITLEDKLGQQYEPYIFAALNSAKVMLSVGTKYEYYHAVWVKNEWSRFLKLMAKDKSKVLIPCYRGIDAYDMPEEFKALQAQDMGKLGAIQDLVRGVEKLIEKPEIANQPGTVQVASGPNVAALLKRGNLSLEDGDFGKAEELFDEILNVNPECAEGYLGMAMAQERCSTINELIETQKTGNKSYQRAKQFADDALLSELNRLEKEIADAIALKKKQEEETLAKRTQKRKEDAEKAKNIISAGYNHTVGLKSDGTVVAVGDNYSGQCYVSDYWTDIVSVSAGWFNTVVFKSDGTVSESGSGEHGKDNVYNWTDIVAISAGYNHTVGLKSDGTVVAVGLNGRDQCYVSNWTDIIEVSAGEYHTVGLKSDGTVVAVGWNEYGQCDVSGWSNIVAISAGYNHTVGLKSDGTVVAVGDNIYGKYDVSGWRDIVAISAGGFHTVGLKTDGTVVAVGYNKYGQCDVSGWSDIVAISAGGNHTVGLKSDGTVVAVGDNKDGQCNVKSWKLFDDLDDFAKKRAQKMVEAREKRKAKEKQKAAYRSQGVCQHCGGAFKGLFTTKCSACGRKKDY